MGVGAFDWESGATGIVVTRKKPGHFVVLNEEGRTDAVMAQGGAKLGDALEKRMAINVNNARTGAYDGSSLAPAIIKIVDPFTVTIAMPAADGEPIVSYADRDAWSRFRVAYDVTLDVTPFRVTGVVLMLPSQDPQSLTERGSELFLAVFVPSVQVGGVSLMDTPRDAILVNRTRIKRVISSSLR